MSVQLAITHSLAEMKASLLLDRQLVSNMKQQILKTQEFEKAAVLKDIEQAVDRLIETIEAAL